MRTAFFTSLMLLGSLLAAQTVKNNAEVPGDQKAPPAAMAARVPVMFAISTPDPESAARWYREKLGLKVLKQVALPEAKTIWIVGSDSLMVEIGPLFGKNAGAEPAKRDPKAIARGIFKIGFFVEDLDKTSADLRREGVAFRFADGSDKELGLRFVIISDPDGNLIQIFERKTQK